ncbi:MAG: AAA family ATPase [SAR86 cluster bacterium]|uniref:AAA family ATPase n=1 Tax=SAR86 cluster bacterium TaxID=2030880 RepID=A0A2A4MLE6_9GAMM|nr:MAG: AAA family ATPase [SAR86 cluster bacterium]
MYLDYFGLNEFPFSLTPNTQFFLNMTSYHEAYNMLMVSLANAEGFIKIVGEVGTGKTMLCRKVLNTLEEDKENYVTAYIANPMLTPKGLFLAFADEIGIEIHQNTGHHKLLKAITEKLVEYANDNKSVVLFVDEAHAMPEQTLEALRLLTNIETEKSKLFQVILFGQPELDVMLHQSSLRQLLQRITFSYKIDTLDKSGVERYVGHRLTTGGYNGPTLFSDSAMKLLYKFSQGVPRLVNVLCHKAMMVAFGKGDKLIKASHMRLAISDTEGIEVVSNSRKLYYVAVTSMAVTVAVILVVYSLRGYFP